MLSELTRRRNIPKLMVIQGREFYNIRVFKGCDAQRRKWRVEQRHWDKRRSHDCLGSRLIMNQLKPSFKKFATKRAKDLA